MLKLYYRCGIELTTEELDSLWSSLSLPPDGLCYYSTLVQHFLAARQEPPPLKNKLPMGKTHNTSTCKLGPLLRLH